MKDAIGQDLKIGDIVAFGSPNGGSISVRIVAGKRNRDRHPSIDEILVRGADRITREYDYTKSEWVDVEQHFEMGRGGWTFTSRVVVINTLGDKELVNFLRENMDETR